MSRKTRLLSVNKGKVQCTATHERELDHCRFCAHSVAFEEDGIWKPSPARACCLASRATEAVELDKVTGVKCDDVSGEGYRSFLSVIS